MKTCTSCKQKKELSEFYKRGDRDSLKSQCKVCQAAYIKKYMADEKNEAQQYSYKRARKDEIKVWFEVLKKEPCTDCGNVFPTECMDFDHIGIVKKKKNLAVLVADGYSKEVILAEVAKCELVCSNCHRIRTHRRGYDTKRRKV